MKQVLYPIHPCVYTSNARLAWGAFGLDSCSTILLLRISRDPDQEIFQDVRRAVADFFRPVTLVSGDSLFRERLLS